MTITAFSRVCICHEIINDAAASVCPRCERPLCPHHSAWPAFSKWFATSELARHRFHSWLSEQSVWENILRDVMVCGGGTQPNPRGPQLSVATSPAELYPEFLRV